MTDKTASTTMFLTELKWSAQEYSAQEVYGMGLPKLVKVAEGIYGASHGTTLSATDILYIRRAGRVGGNRVNAIDLDRTLTGTDWDWELCYLGHALLQQADSSRELIDKTESVVKFDLNFHVCEAVGGQTPNELTYKLESLLGYLSYDDVRTDTEAVLHRYIDLSSGETEDALYAHSFHRVPDPKRAPPFHPRRPPPNPPPKRSASEGDESHGEIKIKCKPTPARRRSPTNRPPAPLPRAQSQPEDDQSGNSSSSGLNLTEGEEVPSDSMGPSKPFKSPPSPKADALPPVSPRLPPRKPPTSATEDPPNVPARPPPSKPFTSPPSPTAPASSKTSHPLPPTPATGDVPSVMTSPFPSKPPTFKSPPSPKGKVSSKVSHPLPPPPTSATEDARSVMHCPPPDDPLPIRPDHGDNSDDDDPYEDIRSDDDDNAPTYVQGLKLPRSPFRAQEVYSTATPRSEARPIVQVKPLQETEKKPSSSGKFAQLSGVQVLELLDRLNIDKAAIKVFEEKQINGPLLHHFAEKEGSDMLKEDFKMSRVDIMRLQNHLFCGWKPDSFQPL